jgi:hypothetical protein
VWRFGLVGGFERLVEGLRWAAGGC